MKGDRLMNTSDVETRKPSTATVAQVLDLIAQGKIEAPEGFTGVENIKKRPVGEWVFDEVTEEELAELKNLGYNGTQPNSRGEAFALLTLVRPKKKRGRQPGSKNKKKNKEENPSEDSSKERPDAK